MKTANKQVAERDEQISKMSNRLTVLENFYEDNMKIIEEEKNKFEQELADERQKLNQKLKEKQMEAS